ncbi:MAG: hypothetical protein ACOY3E_06625 [Pseudomonadota bacterium]
MTESAYENQVITRTVVTENVFTGVCIGTFQEDFQLCEADFLRLKNNGTTLGAWATNVLFAAIGYGVSILPKWFSEIAGKEAVVSQAEWAALAACLLISVALFFIGKFLPNEKKELLNRMDKHFRTAPKSRQFIRGQK